MGTDLFWLFTAVMLFAAFGVVLNRNPIASALCLILTLLAQAGLFATLDSYFLAAIQVWVYAGAVMVLFLFIIMLLDIKKEEAQPFQWSSGLAAFVLAAVLAGAFIELARSGAAAPMPPQPAGPGGDWVTAIARVLFGRYLLALESVGVLLLLAMVGVVVFARTRASRT
ncbi:NADH-quinone oxidoreductase subunit J [Candidatus Methylacidithermus pantelleriae]|uniref:NADH-quinone oxidoreductase subunit J n=1 Tax=Candidatus Methylacidithermus pantelleriae TaxID=2744239 RepID=A0A8J2BR65_9BACT|nr:NADH-quinone oxidoreductase subunit J [Candidatus Methylacidithermus pantelleriae]CAF0700760.1 NADH-quinone oxidoreductase subunit J [Candidatus Methylacidithermus pantelleriae]